MSGYCPICGQHWDGHLTACAHMPAPDAIPRGTGGVADLERVYGPVVQVVPCPSCALLRAEVEHWKSECARYERAMDKVCPDNLRLRAEVADLTRHAEAMARWDCRTCSGGARLGPPDPMGSDCDECPVAAYRRAHPLPPEKP